MQNSSFNNFLSEGKLNIFNEDALDFLPKLENECMITRVSYHSNLF
jgi:hypothetical protein